MLDLVLRGGEVADGTGGPLFRADVGIRDGRIVALAPTIDEPAAKVIDATGLVVAPGFIDVHTHLDAQVFWDPTLAPSPLHGVTTVVGGNCGFSIAPIGAEHADYMMRLLARVEGMPLESLQQGVPWNWQTFGEYLAAVEQAGPVVNFAALAGHSAIRRVVMGPDAVGGTPTQAQQAQMEAHLHDALSAGALGFSSSWQPAHADGDGNPVPSRAASHDEVVGLARVVRDHPGTQLEFIGTTMEFEPHHIDVMVEMSLAAERPLNWNVLLFRASQLAVADQKVSVSDIAAARGARIVGLTYPGVIIPHTSFLSSAFDALPGWSQVMALPRNEKLAALRNPDVRARLLAGAREPQARLREVAQFESTRVNDVYTQHNKRFEGRTLGDIGRELDKDPFDVMCDLAVEEELQTGFAPIPAGNEPECWEQRMAAWTDDRSIIGASDAGAHLDMLHTYDYAAEYLALTRDRANMPVGDAVRRLTDVPARLYGLTGRGRVALGWCADLVVFDSASVNPGKVGWRNDLPGGAGRLYSEPTGIHHVVVNGVEVARDGEFTGDQPGTVLRSGRDTETVLV